MKWTIGIISHPERSHLLRRLLRVLTPQIRERPIEILISVSVGQVGALRQAIIDRATGEYVNFIDDDDLVPGDYIDTIYPLLEPGIVDYVGHRVQLYIDHEQQRPTIHSLKHVGGWTEDEAGYYRGVSHLNPIRTSLARQVPFTGGFGEDQHWAEQVEREACPCSEAYVDRVMYFYLFSTERSLFDEQRDNLGGA